MSLRQLVLYGSLIGALFAVAPAAAEPRTALIVGNAAYSNAPLKNPVNDANDMAAVLRGAGFEVILKTDADQRGILDGVRSFNSALKAKGGVGLFFFSGHGAQVNGENYLVPVGAPITSGAALRSQAVTASEVVDAMAAARNGLNIVVLDACRDNPMGGTAQGLSRIDSSASLFVSFATSPGKVALDGSGRNSPYTKHLAQAVNAANLSLEETFKRTLKGVYQETRGEQTPWISSSFFGDFVFRPGASGGPNVPATPKVAGREAPLRQGDKVSGLPALTGVYRSNGSNPNGSRYRGTTAISMRGDQVRFTWWIGREMYTGVGQFAGRMLVVNWGAKHPVVYTFGPRGGLDGEWADGTATDQLELFARAGRDVPTPGGRYIVNGRNPNGSRYSGTVSIARRGGQFELDWRVGTSSYRGSGTLENNLLTVDWGSTQPLVYALREDGSLMGLWGGGQGEDVLTPAR
jgi:Caspase domain